MKNISAILNTGISIFNGHNILVINFENSTIIELYAYSRNAINMPVLLFIIAVLILTLIMAFIFIF